MKPITWITSIALAISAFIGTTTTPANAHNTGPIELWVCAHERPGNPGDYDVDHSWPAALYPNHEIVRCMIHHHVTGQQVCYEVDRTVSTGDLDAYGYDYYAPCWFGAHQTY